MKTIGMLGGMSWESTLEYYRIVNRTVRDRLGPLHSAKIAMVSVEFAAIEELMQAGRWEEVGAQLAEAARGVERAGADFLVICTNTMHKLADTIEAAISIPILHIADATAAAVHTLDVHRVALLATRFTMEEDFYRGRLEREHGLSVLIPDADDREIIHRVIFEELCTGRIEPSSKAEYLRIIGDLAGRGAEGVVLGCTEIGLLVKPEDLTVPVFDTAHIHAVAAAERAMSD